jgi:hypothetical protein
VTPAARGAPAALAHRGFSRDGAENTLEAFRAARDLGYAGIARRCGYSPSWPKEAVARELAMFKVTADAETRGQIMEFTDIFRGKVVDVSKRSVTVEITGTDDKIEAFERMIRPFGLIEMVRTGEVAVSRGRSAT